MDVMQWIYDVEDAVVPVVVSVVGVFVVLGLCTRFGRLRSLAQMSGFDFGVNVAVGSIIASTVLAPDPSLFRASVALVSIFAMQVLYSVIRRKVGLINNPSSQAPHVVWADGQFIEDNMAAVLFTREDVFHALRKNSISNFDQLNFVIAEATGDVSIYKRGDAALDHAIFKGVVGMERIDA